MHGSPKLNVVFGILACQPTLGLEVCSIILVLQTVVVNCWLIFNTECLFVLHLILGALLFIPRPRPFRYFQCVKYKTAYHYGRLLE